MYQVELRNSKRGEIALISSILRCKRDRRGSLGPSTLCLPFSPLKPGGSEVVAFSTSRSPSVLAASLHQKELQRRGKNASTTLNPPRTGKAERLVYLGPAFLTPLAEGGLNNEE